MLACDLILSLATLLLADGPNLAICHDQKETVTVTVTLEGISLKHSDWMPGGAIEKHTATEQAIERAVASQLSAKDRLAMWSFKTSGDNNRNDTYDITIKCQRNANQLSTSVELKHKRDKLGGIPLPPVKTDLEWRPILDAETPEDFASWLVGKIEVAGQRADRQYENPLHLLAELLSENIPIAHHGHWRDEGKDLFIEIPLPESEYAREVGFHLKSVRTWKTADYEDQRTLSDIYATSTSRWNKGKPVDAQEVRIVTKPRFIKVAPPCVEVSTILKEELMQYQPYSVFFIKYADVWDCVGPSQPEVIQRVGVRQ